MGGEPVILVQIFAGPKSPLYRFESGITVFTEDMLLGLRIQV